MTMAVMERVDAGNSHIPALRMDLERVRSVLDRTDAVLGVADDAIARAQHTADRLHQGAEHASAVLHESAREARRWAPVALAVVGVAAIGVGVVIALRVRQSRRAADDQAFDASI
jgi:hypothetical protein